MEPPSNSNPTVMDHTINFVQARLAGHSFEENIDVTIHQVQQDLTERTHELATTLLEGISESYQILQSLSEEIEAMDFLSTPRQDTENAKNAVQQLKGNQTNLLQVLKLGERDLLRQKQEKSELLSALEEFRSILKKTRMRAYPIESRPTPVERCQFNNNF